MNLLRRSFRWLYGVVPSSEPFVCVMAWRYDTTWWCIQAPLRLRRCGLDVSDGYFRWSGRNSRFAKRGDDEMYVFDREPPSHWKDGRGTAGLNLRMYDSEGNEVPFLWLGLDA